MKLEDALGLFAAKRIAFVIDSSKAFHSLCEILMERYKVSDWSSHRGNQRDIYAYAKHATSLGFETIVRSEQSGHAVTATSNNDRYEWVEAAEIEDLVAADDVVLELNMLLGGAKMGQ